MIAVQQPKTSSITLIIIILIALCTLSIALTCGVDGVVVNGASHAVARHGAEAQQVRDCLSNNGAFSVWKNDKTNRLAQVCQFPDFTFGVQIILNESAEERTAFIFDEIEAFDYDSVSWYMENAGYMELENTIPLIIQ